MNDFTAPTSAAITGTITGMHLARTVGVRLARYGVPMTDALFGLLNWSRVAHEDLLAVCALILDASVETDRDQVNLELRRAAAAVLGTFDAQAADAEILAGWLGGRS